MTLDCEHLCFVVLLTARLLITISITAEESSLAVTKRIGTIVEFPHQSCVETF